MRFVVNVVLSISGTVGQAAGLQFFVALESSYLSVIPVPPALLTRLLRSSYPELRLSALWALKNLLYKCPPETKCAIMADVGQPTVDADAGVREQALHLLRNFADCEDDVDAVFDALGTPRLLGAPASALGTRDTDVVLQAAYAVANLARPAPGARPRAAPPLAPRRARRLARGRALRCAQRDHRESLLPLMSDNPGSDKIR
ncbi:hypothetical protein BJV78DRAFT_1360152 [Lactifluus subvellereus]|nr:hypothetical protein BJV78DRAFT_1360152 [Lactifluus subvellereus]